MKKILVIEDNEQNMYLTTYLLKNGGYEVVKAWNGREGLAVVEQEKPALILLDIQLPEMDGYTVARKIRAMNGLQDVPIVAVTSYAMVGDRERIMEAGCTGYIEKPINPETFVPEIEKYLPVGSAGKRGAP